MTKPYSAACERNQAPILAVLREVFSDRHSVLEIGSGTGQHAVYFARGLPQLRWQTSDLTIHHPGILAWQRNAALPNLLPPLALDVGQADWPTGDYDAVFSANTCHIMSWQQVEVMFERIGRLLPAGGVLCIYGPFNENGHYTSPGNAQFDAALKAQASHMGLRDQEAVERLARSNGLEAMQSVDMPANNRLLIWRRS